MDTSTQYITFGIVIDKEFLLPENLKLQMLYYETVALFSRPEMKKRIHHKYNLKQLCYIN